MNRLDTMSLGEEESKQPHTASDEEHLQAQFAQEGETEPKKLKLQNEHLDKFLKELQDLLEPEAKLQKTIDFMEAALAQPGSPHFKSFWEARLVSLQLFKENINPTVRAVLWAKYSELTKEARRLKEILDEQSAFAVEQIEIAIQALDASIDGFDKELAEAEEIDLEPKPRALEKNLSHYRKLQKELNLLNTQASRINALRKELIRTDMRVRQKNKFFQRLSLAGDKVFPRRKELIREISVRFIEDIDAFIAHNFRSENIEESIFALREEIKALQSLAKILTLNTQAFSQTRLKLSECWDKVKSADKERKKERAHQKVLHKQNAEAVLEKIKAFSVEMSEGNLSVSIANQKLDEIQTFMRQVELGRDEIKALRDELSAARKPVQEKVKAEEQLRHSHEAEKEKQKRKEILDLQQEIKSLFTAAEKLDVNEVIAQRDLVLEKIQNASIGKAEKMECEKLLKPLRDVITEKKEKALLTLSDDDRQSLINLKEVLAERVKRRQEIKNQLEALRRSSGASGLDFEQAMSFKNQFNEEKERLEKINQGIREIEEKIVELEG